jgi:sialidase-1
VLLFSNPDSPSRENMTLRLSHDGGLTWPVTKTIYQGPSAYSSLTEMGGRNVAVLYERGVKDPYESIVFTRLDQRWLGQDSK